MKANLSVRFYLKESTKKNDKDSIYLRIIYARKKSELFTGLYINQSNWNKEKHRAKKDNAINDQLSNIEGSLTSILYSLEKDEKLISASILKDLYTGKNVLETPLLSFYENHVKSIKLSNELAKSSISRYTNTLDHLKQFLIQKKETNLLLINCDFKFLSEFDIYLITRTSHITKQKLERNTVNKHHSRLRTVLIKAVKESLIQKNPYHDFKFKYNPSKRTFLTEDELKSISTHDLGLNPSLLKVRDIFLFSVYTGLRFQDAQSIKINQITTDKKGDSYLEFVQAKTKESMIIPLLKPALEIIQKYSTEEAKITGAILPRISNQKFNTYLKVIGTFAGIEKTLSHHVARHTCATTILLSNEAPIEAVSKWLGHTSIRTTQIYAKITKEYLQKVADKISKKI